MPIQSLSHWDSEKVFVQKFLFEATFISFFYTISYNFTHKKLSSSNLLKKKKKLFLWFNAVNTSLPQNIPATPHKFQKKVSSKKRKALSHYLVLFPIINHYQDFYFMIADKFLGSVGLVQCALSSTTAIKHN